MRDLATSIRDYYDSAAEPVEAVEVFDRFDAELQPQRRRIRPFVVVAAAAVIVFATVGVVALLGLLSEGGEVVDEPMPVTTMIQPGSTATVVAGAFNDVHSLAFGPDGSLWAATSGGVVQWNQETRTPTFFTEADGLQAASVTRIDVAPNGTVWVGTDEWVARYDGVWTSYTDFGGIDVGSLGDFAVGPDGTVWFWADMSPDAGLLHYDAAGWTAVPAPADWLVVDDLWGGYAFSLDVAPDGTVWVGSNNGVLAYDGQSWTHHTVANSTLPSDWAWLVAAAPDGTIWVGTESFPGDEVRTAIPAAGVAAFDGNTWSTHTIEDGLPTNEARVAVGPDGTVWAWHENWVARLEGDRWTSFTVDGDSYGAAVGDDGSLWRPSSAGITQFDGSVVTTLVVPLDAAPTEVANLTLNSIGEPTTTATPLGQITWYRFVEPEGHTLHDIEVTPYGLAATDGATLRWSNDLTTWNGELLTIDPWKLTPDGDDLIASSKGGMALRLVWDDTRWIEGEQVDSPTTQPIESLVLGYGSVVDGVASYGGRHVAVGTTRGRAAVWASDDAINWMEVDLGGSMTSSTAVPGSNPTAVAGADFGWIILEDLGAGWVSVDGIAWVAIPDGMPGARTFWAPQSLSVGHRMIAVSGTEELVFGVLKN